MHVITKADVESALADQRRQRDLKMLELLTLVDWFGPDEVRRLVANIEKTQIQTGFQVEARRG